MPRPVTEVVILPFKPNTSPEEPIKSLKTVLSRQDGFLSMKYGCWEEDNDKIQLIINWKDIAYHKKFEQSGADYDALGAVLGSVLAGPPTMYHVYLDPITRELVFNAPIVEVATFFSVPGDFKDGAKEFLELVGSSKGCTGFVHEDIVEEISRDGSNVKGNAYFAALAWTSIDAHMQAVKEDTIQSKIQLVAGEGKAKEIEMHHVRFTEA
ncbi:hypothetical protein BGZ63DRAFT_464967 [Mariannaea sp. PMI_226]|nr:hypothetical protein BGZ63DRAFT_464967 [Mariannaea sp. PMI_226]